MTSHPAAAGMHKAPGNYLTSGNRGLLRGPW